MNSMVACRVVAATAAGLYAHVWRKVNCLLWLFAAATDARHGGPIAAANLIDSGERYGYAFHLAAYHLMCSDLQQLHIDIMCKWAPWSERAVKALQQHEPPAGPQQQGPQQQQQQQEQQQQQQQLAKHVRIQELRDLVCNGGGLNSVRKALSQAHGTLHSQACQILWQPGWTNGCAKTVGEEGEQLFSYLSKFSSTTRNQSSAGERGVVLLGTGWFFAC
jgi:hypothetical protein